MSKNRVLPTVERLARRSLAAREAEYADEIHRLLEAGLAVMARCGTSSSPRVADIVAEAQVSNEAFYRHFASKEDLVLAIAESGAERLRSYVSHQMGKSTAAPDQIRTWIRCVLAQALDPAVAEPTRAVMWNFASISDRTRSESRDVNSEIAELLVEPLTRANSIDPGRDARAIAGTVFTLLQQFLNGRDTPSAEDVKHIISYCLSGAGITNQ